ncbi:hypothetical protein NSK_008185 [Nannochloropsis salina CCMP1776]|uniref:Sec-independent protein translocase protein TatA n=1 Tax=Nannochloropsis salina CCMP1776 TaxID=1027361 RepID=A0A4D9CPL6_9STRA|nr:hypothetical protein NSK_008185 [Nannochloropsis salina CCMP1776]|eukprot:TFJ80444.1 hypothetical protein NSK_008185 [Nannochloropsis salina CCMP1776]
MPTGSTSIHHVFTFLVLCWLSSVQAFLPSRAPSPLLTSGAGRLQHRITTSTASLYPSRPLTTFHSSVQHRLRGQPLYGIFGLGTPELVVIALVAGIVLGPDKIVDLARGVGKAAGELKAVPQEFEKGLKSGEDAAVQTKADLAKEAKAKAEAGAKKE